MVRRGDATLRLPAQSIEIGGVLASRAEEFMKANPDHEKALRRLLTLRLAAVPPKASRSAAKRHERNAPMRNGRSLPASPIIPGGSWW